MFNLTRRESLKNVTCTPKHIAPNTYNIDDSFKKVQKNAVPFLSTADRKTKIKLNTHAFYVPKYPDPKIKYCNPFNYTEERKFYKYKESPDPSFKLDLPPIKPKKIYCPCPDEFGKLVKGSLCTEPDPEYVPTQNYHISLIAEKIKKDCMYPFYKLLRKELNYNTKKYKGCAWSKYKGQRSKLVTSDTPGPGTYEMKPRFCPRRAEDEEFRAMKSNNTFLPRYIDGLIKAEIREDSVGPCYYTLVDYEKIKKVKSWSLVPVPFISREDRFPTRKDTKLSPDHYRWCDCAMLKQNFSTSKVPFGYSGDRFKVKKNMVPDPNAYGVPDISCICQNRYRGADKPPFDSTIYRDVTNVKEPDEQFVLGLQEWKPTYPERSASYRSTVQRFHIKDSGVPPTGTYGAPDRPAGKTFCISPIPFLYGGPRTDFGPGAPETPGPVKYEVRPKPLESGSYISTMDRFPVKKKICPDFYNLEDSFAKTRATHNVRLKGMIDSRLGNKPPAKDGRGVRKYIRFFRSAGKNYVQVE